MALKDQMHCLFLQMFKVEFKDFGLVIVLGNYIVPFPL
jgi:hypothetical protein